MTVVGEGITIRLTKANYQRRFFTEGEIIMSGRTELYVIGSHYNAGMVTAKVQRLSRWWFTQILQVFYLRIKY